MTPSEVGHAGGSIAQALPAAAAACICASANKLLGKLFYKGQPISLYAQEGSSQCHMQMLDTPPQMPLHNIHAGLITAALGCCRTGSRPVASPCDCLQTDMPCAKAKVLRSINLALARIW